MVTQKDIAVSLGVSRETVKFALNGNGSLAPATRQRVLQEAERLGYSKTGNMNARTLAARRNGGSVRTNAIAVLCSKDDGGHSQHTTPYFLPFWQGIEEAAAARELDVALYLHRPLQLPRLLRDGDVDGVILLTPPGQCVVDQITKPVVALGSQNLSGHNILPNGSEGIRLTVEYLAGLGHRKIAYLGAIPSFFEGENRLDAFVHALKHLGLYDSQLIEPTVQGSSHRYSLDAMGRLLERRADFTAVVCYNDSMAIGAIDALHDRGLRVPEEVSVVGFDNIVPESPFGFGLTSVSFDAHLMGRRAVEIIVDASDEKFLTEIFPVSLVERTSSAPPNPTPR